MIEICREATAYLWIEGLRRQARDRVIEERVREIVEKVRLGRDEVLRELAERFGDPEPRRLSPEEYLLSPPEPEVRELLKRAAANIGRFAEAVALPTSARRSRKYEMS